MRSRSLAPLVTLLAVLTACTDDGTVLSPTTGSSPTSGSETTTSTSPADLAGTFEIRQLDDGGESRRYDVYAPPAAEAGDPLPVVVVMPGTNVALEDLRETTGFDRVADAEGFLVLYVDAPEAGFDATLCCNDTDRDVDFVQAVLADAAATWPQDTSRVYAAGFSVGGAMAYKLAVRAPDVFAAVAPVSGGFYPDPRLDAPESVVPTPPPSVVSFSGTEDPDYDDIAGGLALWRLGAGCDRPASVTVDGAVGVLGSLATCGSAEVDFYTVEGMGHAWPGGAGADPGFGEDASGLDASAIIWAFFATRSTG